MSKPNCLLLTVLLAPLGYRGAQTEVYQSAYRAALADSVITADEQCIMTAIGNTLGLEEETLLKIQRQLERLHRCRTAPGGIFCL